MSELNRISSCTGRSTRAKLSSVSVALATGHGCGKSLDEEQHPPHHHHLNFKTAKQQHVHTHVINKTKVLSDNTDNHGTLGRLFFSNHFN